MASQPRRDFPVPVRVEVGRPDGSHTVEYAVNVSPGGLCLHLQDTLCEGDHVAVEFTLPPSGPTVRAAGRVVWTSWREAEEAKPSFFETGVCLTDVEESVARQLFEYASQPTDRRR